MFLVAGIFSTYGFVFPDFLRFIETDSIVMFIILPLYLFRLDSELGIFNDSFVHRYMSRLSLFKQISIRINKRSIKFVCIMFLSTMLSSFIFFHGGPNKMIFETIILLMTKTFLILNIITYSYVVLTYHFNREALVVTYICFLFEYYICFALILDSRIPLMISWYFYTDADKYLVVFILTLFLFLLKSLSSTLFQRKDFI